MHRYYAGFELYGKNSHESDIFRLAPPDFGSDDSNGHNHINEDALDFTEINDRYEDDLTPFKRVDGLGTGDSSILYKVIPNINSEEHIFQELMREVDFQEMIQAGGAVPRLVAIQGIPCVTSLTDLCLWPIYRHPTDSELPLKQMTPCVLRIKEELEERLRNQIFNHVLIQLYRTGKDHINEHSDKTVDILRGTNIVNFSVGASRTFVLRLKKDGKNSKSGPEGCDDTPEETAAMIPMQKIVLPNNSAFVCSWNTNQIYLHGVRPDKREEKFKHLQELACDGMRISLTFRTVATYQLDTKYLSKELRTEDSKGFEQPYLLFGQGAKIKEIPTRETLPMYLNRPRTESVKDESLRMLAAFSRENREADFDWDMHYSEGFDIITINVSDRDTTIHES